MNSLHNKSKIAVIGLGYVGLPLAVEFGRSRPVIGYDINQSRVEQLLNYKDTTLEVSPEELQSAKFLQFSAEITDISSCNFFIITVPTPVDTNKRPDLGPLLRASRAVASVLKPNDIVIYESTVYPGATEDDCVPVLEKFSNLVFNKQFFVGYSPERINPGDKDKRLKDIVKITSGSTPEVCDVIDRLYGEIVTAGTYKAPSIRVAEAAKVIENTQRDVNIALMNEFSLMFNYMGIDTEEVLKAASTKWNFLNFRPGLVGGHCIGVDPYYLTHKAQSLGYYPEIILAVRRLNDKMGALIVLKLLKEMAKRRIHVHGSRILIMGFTFKENCPDIRNTRVIDIFSELNTYGAIVDIYDPWVNSDELEREYNISPTKVLMENSYDAIILAVAHDQFKVVGADQIRKLGKNDHVIFDIKYILERNEADIRL